MKEMALHILDIMQNSIRAEATCIILRIEEKPSVDRFVIEIEDNGKGMPEAIRSTVTNPFTTTRTLRRVGLGIPLLHQLCEECEGKLTIDSKEGKGTRIKAIMRYHHIDRLPLGDMVGTLYMLIMAKPEIRYIYEHDYEAQGFRMDTEQIVEMLDGLPINHPDILTWIKRYLTENERALYK